MSLSYWKYDECDEFPMHVAAAHNELPAGFDQWEARDIYDRTVAHVAAIFGWLPSNFDRWELISDDDVTVAHQAAYCGWLPDDFNRWELFGLTECDIVSPEYTRYNGCEFLYEDGYKLRKSRVPFLDISLPPKDWTYVDHPFRVNMSIASRGYWRKKPGKIRLEREYNE